MWVYKTIRSYNQLDLFDTEQETLNIMGSMGWELVTAVHRPYTDDEKNVTDFIFKRPKVEQRKPK